MGRLLNGAARVSVPNLNVGQALFVGIVTWTSGQGLREREREREQYILSYIHTYQKNSIFKKGIIQ